ncbi:MAG: proteophosphoglycan precursor [Gammaproteobacteria bacterium]|jgi:hypothetical protein|nr:proteophosphoglycan precursor [Gammaproteobacteria bacterium]|tara:strand:- start:959 stop:1525 length:567 start_codon:yes stop_codon:yes gene_type:complete
MAEHAPYGLLAELEKVKDEGLPPIYLWHPETVKDIDIVIQRDGSWLYMGSPITRRRLVRLFSTVLRKEGDDYFLVTPVVKNRITVEDAPFQAVLLKSSGSDESQCLTFTTDMAEQLVADEHHPFRFEIDEETGEPSPYVMVRDGMEARLIRSVYYQLAELVVEKVIKGENWFGLWSAGRFFKIQQPPS